MFRWSHDLQLDRPTFILRALGARRRLRLLVIGLLVSWGGPAAALSTVSIDLDPMASDRQVEKIVRVGETFEVDILIQEDAADQGAAAASAFEFDLIFDASRISATRVLLGNVLAPSAIGFEDEVGPGLLGYSAVSLGSDEGARSGQLARVTLQAIGVGRATLALAGVLVSEPLGGVLATLVEHASIDVIAVSEANGVTLMLLGLSGMAVRGRLRASDRSRPSR